MRYIDFEQLRALLPSDWENRAALAFAAVAAAAADERSATIKRYSGLWRELAEPLASLSHKKCWYCESKEARSDNAVDHYRPKGPPVESETHPGYWWRAFCWENYRYSCTYCNSKRIAPDGSSGGKQNHFPLLDEAARAFNEDGIASESPTLLDPTRDGDPPLLYFNEEGRAQPRISQGRHRDHWQRANRSIELYHLNHEDTVEQRRALFNSIKRLVEIGRTSFDGWCANNQPAKESYDYVVERLRNLTVEQAELSAAARDIIRGFRDDKHPWIDAIT